MFHFKWLHEYKQESVTNFRLLTFWSYVVKKYMTIGMTVAESIFIFTPGFEIFWSQVVSYMAAAPPAV